MVDFLKFLSMCIDGSQNLNAKKNSKILFRSLAKGLKNFFVHSFKHSCLIAQCRYCFVLFELNFATFALSNFSKLNARKSVFNV